MRPVIWTIIGLLVLSLFSCDPNRVYEENFDFDNRAWIVNNTPDFKFEILEPKKKYNIYYNVRNTLAYPFHNLYITYYLRDSLGNELKSELNDVDLFEKKTGKPRGDGLGDIFDHKVLLLENYQFEEKGKYSLRLEQFMRMDSLPEIMSVGIRVEAVQEK